MSYGTRIAAVLLGLALGLSLSGLAHASTVGPTGTYTYDISLPNGASFTLTQSGPLGNVGTTTLSSSFNGSPMAGYLVTGLLSGTGDNTTWTELQFQYAEPTEPGSNIAASILSYTFTEPDSFWARTDETSFDADGTTYGGLLYMNRNLDGSWVDPDDISVDFIDGTVNQGAWFDTYTPAGPQPPDPACTTCTITTTFTPAVVGAVPEPSSLVLLPGRVLPPCSVFTHAAAATNASRYFSLLHNQPGSTATVRVCSVAYAGRDRHRRRYVFGVRKREGLVKPEMASDRLQHVQRGDGRSQRVRSLQGLTRNPPHTTRPGRKPGPLVRKQFTRVTGGEAHPAAPERPVPSRMRPAWFRNRWSSAFGVHDVIDAVVVTGVFPRNRDAVRGRYVRSKAGGCCPPRTTDQHVAVVQQDIPKQIIDDDIRNTLRVQKSTEIEAIQRDGLPRQRRNLDTVRRCASRVSIASPRHVHQVVIAGGPELERVTCIDQVLVGNVDRCRIAVRLIDTTALSAHATGSPTAVRRPGTDIAVKVESARPHRRCGDEKTTNTSVC